MNIAITPRRLLSVGLLGIVAVLTTGYAGANSVPASKAGDGSAGISGYTVTNIHYTLDSGVPTTVTGLTFTLTPPLASGGAARVSVDNGATWLAAGACSGTATITCSFTASVTSLSTLRVVAAQ